MFKVIEMLHDITRMNQWAFLLKLFCLLIFGLLKVNKDLFDKLILIQTIFVKVTRYKLQ